MLSRWRFWVSQGVWALALIISGIVGSEGDPEAIPFILLFAFVISGFINRWGANKQSNESAMTRYNGHIIARVLATAFIWITFMGGMVTAVIEMAGWGILLALIMMIPAMAFTAFIWLWERISGISTQQLQSVAQQSEKRKRNTMESLLSNLSDDERNHLRHRLEDDDTDEHYHRGISDDGELIYQKSH